MLFRRAARLILITVALLGGYSVASAQDDLQVEYKYWLANLRAFDSCQEVTAFAVPRFAAATGLKVNRSECSGFPNESGYGERAPFDIKIYYTAGSRVQVVTTDVETRGYRGSYVSEAGCRQDLPRQAQLFQQLTGLTAAFAFCDHAENTPSSHDWILRLEGFGRTRQRTFHYDRYLTFTPTEQQTRAFIDGATQQIKAQGGTVFRAFVRTDYLDTRRFEVFYYAPRTVYINL